MRRVEFLPAALPPNSVLHKLSTGALLFPHLFSLAAVRYDISVAKRNRFAARRAAVGWSQMTLAQHLGVRPFTVQRWEAGTSSPLCRYRRPLADALEVSITELSKLLDSDSECYHYYPSKLNAKSEGRNSAILDILSMPKDIHVLFNEPKCSLDHEALAYLSRTTGAALEQKYAQRGGAAVCEIATSILRQLNQWIQLEEQESMSILLEVFKAELSIWVGWIAIDAGKYTLAQNHLNEALVAAKLTTRADLELCALNNLSVLYIRTGYPQRALRSVEAALKIPNEINNLRTLLHLRSAIAYAYLKNESESERHSVIARQTFEQNLGPEVAPTWFRSFTEHELIGLIGWAKLLLGIGDQAADSFLFAAKKVASPRTQLHYYIQEARALAIQGDAHSAARAGTRVISDVLKLQSQPIREDFHRLFEALRPAKEAQAKEFVTTYMDLMLSPLLLAHE